MKTHRSVWGIVAALLLLLTLASANSAATANAADRVTLTGSKPAWANSKSYVSATDPSTDVGFRVYLGWTNSTGAEALARSVSDPKSASYGQYVSPNAFRAQFSPSAASVAQVQNWLKSQGFSVNYTPQNNLYVSAEGTAAQVQTAFGTTLSEYKVQGKTVRSPSADVTIPASLSGIVQAVIGLDESFQFVHTDHVVEAPPSGAFVNAPPMSTYWAQLLSPYAYPNGFNAKASATVPWTVKGYTPQQIKGAYGISGYDGAGQTVVVIDAYASPTILQDVNTWSANRGIPQLNPSQLRQVVPPGIYNRPQNPAQDPQGWYGEETLDIEAVHGMAPAANIVYVGAPNNYQDLDAALAHTVDQRLGQIVTNSYGWNGENLPTGYIKPFNDILIQAAAEGIGVYFSSGDNGDETAILGYASPDFPAVSPWVTAVGGTALAVGVNNTRVFETGWGTSNYNCNTSTLACSRTSWLYGAGGGVSKIFAAPSYQSSLGLSGRAIPDVSALADPQAGYLIGQTQAFPDGNRYSEYRIGGTSLASPIFAGLMALADQAAGRVHGFANPVFYANAGGLYDVLSVKTTVARRNYNNGIDATNGTSDRLRTFDDYSGSPTQQTKTGWDNVTGLGAPTSTFISTYGK